MNQFNLAQPGPIAKAALYFHYPCYDGLVSAVLAWVALEKRKAWNITDFYPVNYRSRPIWLKTTLQVPCAVVDFLYHPAAEFWADHHQTTFLTREVREDFERRKESGCLLFDHHAGACASVLYRHLNDALASTPHFEDLVRSAEKIDSAGYSSVQEAILGAAPALRISRSLADEPDYACFLIKALRQYDLNYVAELPQVKAHSKEAEARILAGLEQVRKTIRLEHGNIAVFEIEPKPDEVVSRYAPYYFFPDALYSIGIIHSEEGFKITAMRNPWRSFQSIPLGRILEQFGGGGHQRVASVSIPFSESHKVHDVVKSLVSQIQRQTTAPM